VRVVTCVHQTVTSSPDEIDQTDVEFYQTLHHPQKSIEFSMQDIASFSKNTFQDGRRLQEIVLGILGGYLITFE
jgi:hypothetical protein